MEREDLTLRLEWLKEEGAYKPGISGKRVELTEPFELTPIEGDDQNAGVQGKGPVVVVPATDDKAKEQTVAGEPLLKEIAAAQGLKTVSMEGNSYSKPFCQALAHVLKSKTSIERALFNDMFVGRKIPAIHPSLGYFADAFRHFDNLTVLDFRFVARGGCCGFCLCEGVCMTKRKKKKLCLCPCVVCVRGGERELFFTG